MVEPFLKNIKQLRKSRRLGQEKLADAIGISCSAYRRYESGERDMPLSAAVRLAAFYQVSLDQLVGRED